MVREITGKQKGRVYACLPVLDAIFREGLRPEDAATASVVSVVHLREGGDPPARQPEKKVHEPPYEVAA